ncbi:MAG: hypothetical protein ACK5C5_02630, partial [Bacteroidota bacterium]
QSLFYLVSLASMRYAYSATADDFSNDVRFNPCSSVVGNANFDQNQKLIRCKPHCPELVR